MTTGLIVTTITIISVAFIGLFAWTLKHTADRRAHINGQQYVSREECKNKHDSDAATLKNMEQGIQEILKRLPGE